MRLREWDGSVIRFSKSIRPLPAPLYVRSGRRRFQAFRMKLQSRLSVYLSARAIKPPACGNSFSRFRRAYAPTGRAAVGTETFPPRPFGGPLHHKTPPPISTSSTRTAPLGSRGDPKGRASRLQSPQTRDAAIPRGDRRSPGGRPGVPSGTRYSRYLSNRSTPVIFR